MSLPKPGKGFIRFLIGEVCMRWLMVLFLPLALVLPAFGFGTGVQGCSGDCAACHAVKQEEAAKILKAIDAATTVESVGPSPVRGLYQVVIRKGNETGVVYLDFSKKFLIAGRIFDTGNKQDVTADALDRARRIDPAKLPLDNALVLGNPDGSRKLYVFTDPECPFCAKLHQELVALTKEDSRLQVRILLTPLDVHPHAAAATDAIICAAKKNMAEGVRLLEESFRGEAIAKCGCDRSYAEEGKKVGREFGVGLTPTMVLPDGRVVAGARTKEEIRRMLDEAAASNTGT